MKILLVEPNYKNKYPPVGLMKISTYHKNRGDQVFFTKGTNEIEQEYDIIYITTLFTFYYDVCLTTIKYYEEKYQKISKIFIGGILASIMTEKLVRDVNDNSVVLTGQLTSSSLIGQDDNVNIDQLPLDYNLLYQIDYEYPTCDDYISYTTRGCTNKCKFCAVPMLEPVFEISNNLLHQVNYIKHNYGEKKNLLLLDNNILSLPVQELNIIVQQIKALGYTQGAKYFGDLKIEKLYKKYEYFESFGLIFYDRQRKIISDLIEYFESRCKRPEYRKFIDPVLKEIETFDYGDYQIRKFILDIKKSIIDQFKKLDRRQGQLKFVDFNQGMDARQLTDEKMRILSQIPIKPFRLALDDMKMIPIYENAVRLAAKYGVKHFSNYILYNFNDTPEELYTRLKLNVDLAEELNIHIYSFPMKYSDINKTDRKNIGKYWNSYYLANFRRILKPTLGVVGRGKSYFTNAFGESHEEFLNILKMPYDFVTYREFFRKNGLTEKWKKSFYELDHDMQERIILEVSSSNYTFNHPIMKFYRIRKDKLL